MFGFSMIDIQHISDPKLRTVAEMVLAGEPVPARLVPVMLATCDILGLGSIAHHVRRAITATAPITA
jgi:hypothetical protein